MLPRVPRVRGSSWANTPATRVQVASGCEQCSSQRSLGLTVPERFGGKDTGEPDAYRLWGDRPVKRQESKGRGGLW